MQLASPEQRQLPDAHLKPGGQARPQAPQLRGSVARSAQPAGVWQQTWPAAQDEPELQLHWSDAPTRTHASATAHVALPQMQRPVVASHVPPAAPSRQRPSLPAQPQLDASGAAHLSPLPPPPWRVQSLSQPPQSVLAIVTSVSQPSSGSGEAGCTQFPKPSWQLELQRPALQARDSTCWPEQTLPQPPQFWGSSTLCVSQPSSGAGAGGLLQLASPAAQLELQLPLVQSRLNTPVDEQARPQAPQ